MIGFDLQEVERIKDAEKLLERIALENEIAYINRFKHVFKEKVASLWSVKEACYKALCTGGEEISFKEIELCHKQSGAPFIKLYGRALEIFKESGASEIEVSLSHQKSIVGAVVLIK